MTVPEFKSKHYAENQEYYREKNKEWVKENKKRYLDNAKRYRENNKEKVKKSYAVWSEGKPLYSVWRGMKRRCYDQKCDHYYLYGARGVTVCERWMGLGGYENFEKYMPSRPSKRHSIDRINTNGNYEPGNIKWSTSTEQQRNRRVNLMVKICGVSRCLTEWSEISGINFKTLQKRVNNGWTEDILLSPPNPKFRNQGKSKK